MVYSYAVSYTHLAGTAHCGLIDAGDGRYFMAHQGRLSPQNQLMDLHVREAVSYTHLVVH